MIQRIQSLFLLLAGICAFILVFYPISRMMLDDGTYANFMSMGLRNASWPYQLYMTTYPITVLAALSGTICLVTIFLYRNRQLQIRFTVYNILITIGLIVVILIYYINIKNGTFTNNVSIENHHFSFAAMLPLVNIILLFQAFRAIRRDDLLVKSYDRLR